MYIRPVILGLAIVVALVSRPVFAEDQPAAIKTGPLAFALHDLQGQTHKLEDQFAGNSPRKCVVLFFLGTECPLVKMYAPRLQEIADKYAAHGVAVYGVSSNQQDSLSELQRFARENKITYPILKDAGNKLADLVDAQRTPEVFVVNHERRVVYHGRIDDQYTYGMHRVKVKQEYLVPALESLLAGRPIETSETESVGCHIGRVLKPDENSRVTYSQHIAPIFQNRCVECHRQGEIGPFPLMTYDDTVGWAEMIREVVDLQRMPPWHASPDHGKFANDPRLSESEKQLIFDWVDAGAPQGDPKLAPPPREFAKGWKIGEPDAVFYMSPRDFEVRAQGELRYQYFTVDPGFQEDKWIQAAECRPGNASVVHHIIVGVIPPKGTPKELGSLHSEWLVATAPGARPLLLPPGYAKFVPAGSKLLFQMHYTPNGKATTDRSSVAFKFADPTTVKKQVGTEKAGNIAFAIPPGDANYPVQAVHKFNAKSEILALFPHMHLRGKSFRYTLEYPDRRREILLDLPHYDFNWQNSYVFDPPLVVPAGSKMICDATYDNSAENIANPDPTQTVRWGDQTWEEMMIGYFDMALADQDLTKKSLRSRTQEFEQRSASDKATVSTKLSSLAPGALDSADKLASFGIELRTALPQLDRICWTTIDDKRFYIRQVAEEDHNHKAVPGAKAGAKFDLRLAKLVDYARGTEPKSHGDLTDIKAFDLNYMARAYASSYHVPVEIGGQKGTLNFWSTEKNAFNAEAQKLLLDAARLLATPAEKR